MLWWAGQKSLFVIQKYIIHFLRFTHGGDECLTIPSNWSMESAETK